MSMAQDMPTSTKERVKGTPSVKTEQIHGTVVYAEIPYVVVKLAARSKSTRWGHQGNS
jgi:hypothetical protein